MKKIWSLVPLLVATLFVHNAGATMLPYSSHYQGRSYFDDAGVTGRIDFAVYDTLGVYGNEWTGAGFTAPGGGRYIYAYQIFNDVGSADAIEFCTIMGIDDPPTPHQLTGINTIDSENPWQDYPPPLLDEAMAPTDETFNLDETRGTWDFAGGILAAGEYSWFLVFSSTNDWTEGKYLMETAGGFPITSSPEPCTLAFLVIGGAFVFTRRKNPV